MRAIVNTPDDRSRVALADDLPEPTPAPDEVLLTVEAFSLNRGELSLLSARPARWRPGQDVAGTVLAAAADGSGPPAGTRVVGLVEGAGWAERVAVSVRRLAALPAGVDVAAAATLGIAGRTALRSVALGGNLLGRRVLVTGAAGGLGRFQTQLAAIAGADVVAVTRRPDDHKKPIIIGAGDVVARTTEADGLFDLVLDGVGGRTLTSAVSKVTPGGTVVLVGASDPEPAQLNLLDFVGHENAIIHTYFSYAQPETIDHDLAALAGLLADGRLTPYLGIHAGWETIHDAIEALSAGQVNGKAVLTVTRR